MEQYVRWFGVVLTLTDMQAIHPGGQGACLRHVVTVPHPNFNDIGRYFKRRLPCSLSPIFHWFSDTMLQAQQVPLRDMADSPLEYFSATLVLRRRRVHGSSAWQKRRVIPKLFLEEVQRRVSKLCLSTKLQVKLIAFEDYPFTEQVRIARSTRVFTATHGAALAHMVFMPAHSHVIEVWEGPERHYLNWASMLGHSYERAITEGQKPGALADTIVGALRSMELCHDRAPLAQAAYS